jgi:uncharacterized protein (TIGR00255 family)
LCVPVLLHHDLPEDALLCPMIDARRMEVYAAVYDRALGVKREIAADIVDEHSYLEFLNEHPVYFFGNGAAKCRGQITHPNAHFIDDIRPLGKVDFSLWIEKDVSDTATPINAALVENYYNQIKSISEMTHIPMPEDWFATLLRMPDVLTKADVQELSEDEWEVVRRVVEEAINHLVDFRKQEGTALEKKFNEKIDNIERLLKSIEPYETERVAKIRERITDALEKTISVDYDKNRLEQELIYYIEKLDINEEKQRLSNHLRYFRETMAGGHGQGKKLGFIAQEMVRQNFKDVAYFEPFYLKEFVASKPKKLL